MTKFKTTILFLAVCLTSTTTKSQTIKDFFIPSSPNNMASFYTPNSTGGRTDMTRMIYYVDKGNTLDITDANFYNGNPTAMRTITMTITDSEVKMIKSVSSTIMETLKQRAHNPPEILLKKPAQGRTVTWTYTQIPGDLVECKASWTTLTIDGKVLKTIKVEEVVEGLDATTINYYVQGIGLFKSDIIGSDGKVIAFWRFAQLSYSRSVN